MVTSGRPVVTARAVFAVGLVSKTLAPRTPFSSHGWWLTGSFPASGVAAYFQSSPPRSFGAGLPAGRRKVLKSWALNPGPPPYGKSACADAAISAPPPTSASATQMRNPRTLLPARQDKRRRGDARRPVRQDTDARRAGLSRAQAVAVDA